MLMSNKNLSKILYFESALNKMLDLKEQRKSDKNSFDWNIEHFNGYNYVNIDENGKKTITFTTHLKYFLDRQYKHRQNNQIWADHYQSIGDITSYNRIMGLITYLDTSIDSTIEKNIEMFKQKQKEILSYTNK
jgi:hypothetical protein